MATMVNLGKMIIRNGQFQAYSGSIGEIEPGDYNHFDIARYILIVIKSDPEIRYYLEEYTNIDFKWGGTDWSIQKNQDSGQIEVVELKKAKR